ncbi:MAG: hypothetical protein JWL60_2151 [Gemmatimonadetes bacterium]|nr:hypothetical protein [Gemmatimonadota bacterium]
MMQQPRQIRDASGEVWIVWQVTDPVPPRRDLDTEPVSISWVRQRSALPALQPGYSDGWLAFKSATERRRLSPFPRGWAWRSEEELLELLQRATPAGAPAVRR